MCPEFGQLSKQDIKEKEIVFPKDEKYDSRYKAASYDLTPTAVAMSVKRGVLETVYKDKTREYTESYYIYVRPKDSVLIVTNEFISVPRNVAAQISSRVTNVAAGFGHISTTVDPGWKGALLIALSNPTNKPLRINVGIDNRPNPLATITFNYLCKESDEYTDHQSMRTDLLDKVCYKNRPGNHFFLKLFSRSHVKYTNLFYDFLDSRMRQYSVITWEQFLNEFSRFNTAGKAYKFVIRDNVVFRSMRWLESHTFWLKVTCTIVVLLFIILILLKVLPTSITDILQLLVDL